MERLRRGNTVSAELLQQKPVAPCDRAVPSCGCSTPPARSCRPPASRLDAEGPCAVPAPDALDEDQLTLLAREDQNSTSSSSICSGSSCAAAIHSAQVRPCQDVVAICLAHRDRASRRSCGNASPPARTSRPRRCVAAEQPGTVPGLQHSRQISVMRSISARAADHRVKWRPVIAGSSAARPQRGEAGVHLPRDRPAMGARHAVARQHMRRRECLIQILGERQRVPHRTPSARGRGRGSTTTATTVPPGCRDRRERPPSPRTQAATGGPAGSRAATRRSNFCC